MGNGCIIDAVRAAAPASDWWDWERAGHAPLSGDGNGFGTRYAEDFSLLASLGLTHHRLSLEWARLEPEPGVHDAEFIRYYRDVLTAWAGRAPLLCRRTHSVVPRACCDRREKVTQIWIRPRPDT